MQALNVRIKFSLQKVLFTYPADTRQAPHLSLFEFVSKLFNIQINWPKKRASLYIRIAQKMIIKV